MAYISGSEALFRAIVNDDVPKVREFLARDDIDVNRRDHCGRTPLHVAAMSSRSLEVLQVLLDKGARLIARLQDGRTALHIAAGRGQNKHIRFRRLWRVRRLRENICCSFFCENKAKGGRG